MRRRLINVYRLDVRRIVLCVSNERSGVGKGLGLRELVRRNLHACPGAGRSDRCDVGSGPVVIGVQVRGQPRTAAFPAEARLLVATERGGRVETVEGVR